MNITISNIPEISAIYFALLQCGYDYFSIERSREHINSIRDFVNAADVPSFFAGTRQNTCAVYHYWPRAAILEAATFYLLPNQKQFGNYEVFQSYIMSAGNIADHERNQELWDWLSEFPAALTDVLVSDVFQRYLAWDTQWLNKQRNQHKTELQLIRSIVDACISKYNSPIREVQIVINPIKCVYSSDYHLDKERFVFCSGAFRADSVVHEFLHHVIHSAVMENAEIVLAQDKLYADMDTSYYLTGDRAGKLNAFEEYAVRQLTKDMMAGRYPDSLYTYLWTIATR